MKPTSSIRQDFQKLHEKYMKTNERMVTLQEKAIHGMRIVGVGCVNEESKAEFLALKTEIEQILSKMKEICDSLV